MTQTIRSAGRTSHSAMLIFALVYLATLAIIFGGDRLRALPAGALGTAVGESNP